MIVYLLLGALLVGALGGGFSVNWWHDTRDAKHERDQAKAEAKVLELTQQAEKNAADKVAAMDAAYAAGESHAKTIEKTIYIKGQDYVRDSPQVFANPQCVLPATSLQLVNSETADVRATAAANIFGFGVPDSGRPAGRADGNVVLSPPAKPATVEGVHPQVQPPGGTGQVPGSGVQRPDKPTPK